MVLSDIQRVLQVGRRRSNLEMGGHGCVVMLFAVTKEKVEEEGGKYA